MSALGRLLPVLMVALGCGDQAVGPAGTGGSGGQGGQHDADGGGGVAPFPPIPSPCVAYCEAAAATPGCDASLGDCESRCDAFAASQAGVCVHEYDDLFKCFARSELVCEGGVATPSGGCAHEAVAVAECLAVAPCGALCERAREGGCEPEDCLDDCERAFTDRCFEEAEAALSCEAESSECRDGDFRPDEGCRDQVRDLASCESFGFEVCVGYCRMVEFEGCTESLAACRASCAAASDGPCGFEFSQAARCRVHEGFACDGGVVQPSPDCDYDERNLAECEL